MRNLLLVIIFAAITAVFFVSLSFSLEVDNAIRSVVLKDQESLIHFCGLFMALGLGFSAVARK